MTIGSLILTILVTTAISKGIGLCLGAKMVKDTFDKGFVFEIDQLSNYKGMTQFDNPFVSMFLTFFPYVNILYSGISFIQYETMKEAFFAQLDLEDIIRPMNALEKEEYDKNPTILNAIMLDFIVKDRISKAHVVYLHRGNEKGKIYFEYSRASDKFRILKKEGTGSLYTEKSLENLLSNYGITKNDLFKKSFVIDQLQQVHSNDQKKTMPNISSETKNPAFTETCAIAYDSSDSHTEEHGHPYVYKK